MKVVFALSLILVSSAFAQVQLPPEEIGFLNVRLINELAVRSSPEKSKDIDFMLVQALLEQDPESKCKSLQEFRDGRLGTKSILEKRNAAASKVTSPAEQLNILICGIEEFALYDATQNNLLTRRLLNRARQLTLNIEKINHYQVTELSVRILKKAYELALTIYKSDRDDLPNSFAYAKIGTQFTAANLSLINSIMSPQVAISILESSIVWLASDLAIDENAGNFADTTLQILTTLSTTPTEPTQRQQQLTQTLKSALSIK
jgi:hypothetical protein